LTAFGGAAEVLGARADLSSFRLFGWGLPAPNDVYAGALEISSWSTVGMA
jgi:hypothetical protein